MAVLLAALVLLTFPRWGLAAAPSRDLVDFAWIRGEGAEGCPSAGSVARDVAARLGRDPFSREARRSIEGSVTREAPRWMVRIRMYEAGTVVGTRELTSESPDCAAITAASVLAIAISIDPEAALLPLPSASASPIPSATPPPAPVEPPRVLGPILRAPERPASAGPADEEPRRKPSSAPFPRLTVSARGMLGIDILPRAAPGLALAAGLQWRAWEGWAGVLWLPEVKTSDQAFAFGLSAAWLGACLKSPRVWRLTFATCSDVRAGAMHAVVVALDAFAPLSPGDRAWVALSLSERMQIALPSPLLVELGAEIIAPLIRRDFAIQGRSTPIFSTPPIAVAPFLGVGVTIP